MIEPKIHETKTHVTTHRAVLDQDQLAAIVETWIRARTKIHAEHGGVRFKVNFSQKFRDGYGNRTEAEVTLTIDHNHVEECPVDAHQG